mmetsp:Transcript_85057/g.214338  ORF Transcript_85057/g.214338 Transcript_85057/m.214338 type:complete len:572 (-) Transcript_85057:397-2112(-)|eukprot:CAMPEP_0115452656 /NCGR_PEP_ID=MMETSP0271-20121206/42709_1 /TAXON_ID=71861 /ORGANISM="Scrippsiella trochoidea, Strain CCMP3099" /LENGTH=571 /DNA_ID=CAMNT_0002878995 /DNA_START=16 /DNA_END=1731 /DNA_ORIENTATION=+
MARSLVACLLAFLLHPEVNALPVPWWRALRSQNYKEDIFKVKPFAESGEVAKWFCQQKQDHFDPQNSVTWCQRYFVNATFWNRHKGGPVFVCVGGEGPAFSDDVLYHSNHCNDMTELAPQVGALLFAVEHRFYGYSIPNVSDLSTRNLDRFLSSQQAAADLASFHAFARKEYKICPMAKWVTFGGSYPGMLASYARLLYPDLFHAAVASSAPVQAAVDFPGYLDVVAEALAVANYEVGGSAACLAAVSQGHDAIGRLLKTGEGKRDLERRFELCGDKPLDIEANIALWVGFGVIPVDAQSNAPECDTPLCNIAKVCQAVLDAVEIGDGDPLYALEEVARQARISDGLTCTDVDFAASMDEMKDTSLTNWIRVWTFQTCKEFGFYQTCADGSNCPFTKGYNTLAFNVDQCQELFDISPQQVARNVEATSKFYGGDRPNSTRVLWVNGQIDPWHYLSVLVSPGHKLPTIWVPGDSHHYWTHPSLPSNTAYDREAREAIWDYVKAWLGDNAGVASHKQRHQHSSVASSFLARPVVVSSQRDVSEEIGLLQVEASPRGDGVARDGFSSAEGTNEL